jgi:hypothetical protein
MFMIVTYPWPITSAHVELTGPQPPDPAMSATGATEDTIDQRARHLELMIRWTDRERLRFQWYRFRIAVNDAYRRSVRTRVKSPVSRDRTVGEIDRRT